MAVYRFSVCPHDTAQNIVGWFLLNTYLQRRLGCAIHFEPMDDFIREREAVLNGGYHLVYANPFSACLFRKILGFVPVARPIGKFDETLLVRGAGEGIPNRRPLRIASATDKLIVHFLGLSLLEQLNIPLSECEFHFVGTHLKAAQAVMQGSADLGFVYRETWEGLTESHRQSLTIIGKMGSNQAFHCFCIAPEWKDRREALQAVLCDMQNDPHGKRILDEIRCSAGFEPIEPDSLDPLIEWLERRGVM